MPDYPLLPLLHFSIFARNMKKRQKFIFNPFMAFLTTPSYYHNHQLLEIFSKRPPPSHNILFY